MIDLIKAQKYMKDNNIDAWILYDFKGVWNVYIHTPFVFLQETVMCLISQKNN